MYPRSFSLSWIMRCSSRSIFAASSRRSSCSTNVRSSSTLAKRDRNRSSATRQSSLFNRDFPHILGHQAFPSALGNKLRTLYQTASAMIRSSASNPVMSATPVNTR